MAEIDLEKDDGALPSDEGKDLDAGKDQKKEPLQPKHTEKEKAEYNLKKIADRVRELGGDPTGVLGIRPNLKVDEDLSEDTPLTVGMLRELQKQDSKKTALQLAEDIEDETEREEVKTLLEKRFIPSSDPNADLVLVRAAVNAKRTTQVAAELARKQAVKRTAAGGSMPVSAEELFEPTEQEKIFMAPPYNVSKDKIIEARKKAQEKG